MAFGPALGAGRLPDCGSGRGRSGRFRLSLNRFVILISWALFWLLASLGALAAQDGGGASGLAPGDLAISGFAGTKLSSPSLPAGTNPIDQTVIDESAAALTVYDLGYLGGPLKGQLVSPLVKFAVPAKDIGQVYSLIFDPGKDGLSPSLYAAATSAYGLNIIGAKPDAKGLPVRLKTGEAGARFMPGQFGGLDGASPGAIWKIDGRTGEATLLADTAFTGIANSGPGLGGLAIDPASRNLYASDLDTGLIHRFGLDYNAANLGQFDHGVAGRPARGLKPLEDDGKRADITSPDFKAEDPSTWGFTPEARRVRGLTVHGGRLYYSVDQGPEIWSVGLEPDGAFAEDARSELEVKTEQPVVVANIAFDAKGDMILGLRRPLKASYDYTAFTEPGSAKPLLFKLEQPDDPATPGIWSPEPQTYNVGTGPGNEAGAGGAGLQYAFTEDGSLDTQTCDASIVFSVEGIAEDGSGHGAQVSSTSAVEPADAPATSALINFSPKQDKPDLIGHVGDTQAFQICKGEAGYPPIAGGSLGGFPPIAGGGGGGFPPIAGGGGFPPVAGGGGTGLPPVVGGGGTTVPETPGGGGGKTTEATNGEPAQIGDLAITKLNTSTHCDETKVCRWEILVENTTEKEAPGPITVQDTLSAGNAALATAKLVESTAGWTCSSAPPNFACTRAEGIPPRTSIQLQVGFETGPIGAAEAVKNCTTITPLPAAPGPAPAPKPAAPEQKGELVPYGNSLLKFASFAVPQQTPLPWRFLHRVADGDPSGKNLCVRWEKDGFSVNQRTGGAVSFLDLKQVPRGGEPSRLTGTASRITSNGPQRAEIQAGTITQDRFSFVVRWPNDTPPDFETVVTYQGTVGPDGSVTGKAITAGGGTTSFTNVAPLKCLLSETCDAYGRAADGAMQEAEQLNCAIDREPAGRWTRDQMSHEKWCMAQPVNAPIIAQETNARTALLVQCKAKAPGCDDYAKQAIVGGEENKRLNCSLNQGFMSADLAEQKKLCMQTAASPESLLSAQKTVLDQCRAQQAAANPPAAAGAAPNKEGLVPGVEAVAPAPAAPAATGVPPGAPQSCAVMPTTRPTPGGDGGAGGGVGPGGAPAGPKPGEPVPQGNGLSISKEAVVADCSGATGCEFKIKVKNDGNAPVDKLTVVDAPTGDGALDLPGDDMAVLPRAPWSCSKGFPTRCERGTPLAPGASDEFNMGLKIGAKATATTMNNCASVEPQLPPVAAPAAPVMAPLSSDKDGFKTELVPAGNSCAKAQSCPWRFTTTNTSAETRTFSIVLNADFVYTDPVTSVRGAGVKVDSVTANPAMACGPRADDKAKQLVCNVGEVTLTPGQSYTADMNLTVGAPPNIGDNGSMLNAVTVSYSTAKLSSIGKATAGVAVAPGAGGQGAIPRPSRSRPAPACHSRRHRSSRASFRSARKNPPRRAPVVRRSAISISPSSTTPTRRSTGR
ncbi:hypothetical protein [Methyloligella halotolerans]|uniref:hypothetical protein n=1 Tax=Methyloligella halotolerans TaxID=1177755 RepID=UPI00114C9B3B|nr:hypothetical protein [Methyloligella halotolerans]